MSRRALWPWPLSGSSDASLEVRGLRADRSGPGVRSSPGAIKCVFAAASMVLRPRGLRRAELAPVHVRCSASAEGRLVLVLSIAGCVCARRVALCGVRRAVWVRAIPSEGAGSPAALGHAVGGGADDRVALLARQGVEVRHPSVERAGRPLGRVRRPASFITIDFAKPHCELSRACSWNSSLSSLAGLLKLHERLAGEGSSRARPRNPRNARTHSGTASQRLLIDKNYRAGSDRASPRPDPPLSSARGGRQARTRPSTAAAPGGPSRYRPRESCAMRLGCSSASAQQRLNLRPLPHGHSAFRDRALIANPRYGPLRMEPLDLKR